ncbi:porin family protein [Vibrio cholerae]|nr:MULTISPECIES: outer membrane beta-barrel protein [Vibrio]EJL6492300.1 porin family protein [Vibrio cholerae]EJL6644160.1 porin family protein [Vibrio cholerae]MCA2422544.1 porin family protein [Vibrio alginolyticus]MCA2447202.1 porin family protein [Vibrio alginolyticus]MCR9814392.1 porin family protein [Vibrio parahaemolyticus]
MTKQLVLAAVIATTSLASGSVLAMKNESTVSEYKPSISNFISPYISSVGMGNGLDGNGLGIRLGYKLSDNWGVVGDASFYDVDGNLTENGKKLETDYDGWMASIGPSYYINERLSVFATIGIAQLTGANYTYGDPYTVKMFNPEIHQLVDVTTRDKENLNTTANKNVVVGLGINYALGDYYVINAAYKRFSTDITMSSGNNTQAVDVFEVGFGFRF